MILALHTEISRIDHVFQLAAGFSGEEELSHWARYLCVLTAGLIESAARLIFSEYARTHSSAETHRFVVGRLERVTNVNTERLRELMGSFSPVWRDAFDRSTSHAQKDAVDSVLANRHNIVHGRSVGISLVRVKGYYDLTVQVVSWISNEVLGY